MIKQLVELKLVRNFADIYKLDSGDLKKLELFKEKKISNLLGAINKSKEQPLSRLIYALGIRHVGEKAALVLAQRFKNMDNLFSAKIDTLDSIYEVGEVMASSIIDYFSQSSTKKLIVELRKSGLNFKQAEASIIKTLLTGKTVVFTGELLNYSRQEAEEILRNCGGKPVSSVSKQADFVVAGSNPGTKFDKAKKLGIQVINESKFEEMIK